MTSLLGELVASVSGMDANTTLTLWVLVALRLAPATVMVPWLTLPKSSAVLRNILVLTLSISLALPLMTPQTGSAVASIAGDVPAMILAGAHELVIGLIYALGMALPFVALEWGGRLQDTWRGASLAEVLTPMAGERTSPLGDLMLMLGVSCFLLAGGHTESLRVFAAGFERYPPGMETISNDFLLMVPWMLQAALELALAIAMPVAVAAIAVDLSLGLAGRVAPQFPLFFAGMPLRALGGVAMGMLLVPVLVDVLPEWFVNTLDVLTRASTMR